MHLSLGVSVFLHPSSTCPSSPHLFAVTVILRGHILTAQQQPTHAKTRSIYKVPITLVLATLYNTAAVS